MEMLITISIITNKKRTFKKFDYQRERLIQKELVTGKVF